MIFFVNIHKIALMITILCGMVILFKQSPFLKKLHKLFAIATVVTIAIYLIQISFNQVGYIIYTILLICLFFTPERLKTKKKFLYHMSVFITAVICLITAHIV